MSVAVDFDRVSIVFGDHPERALPLMDQGKSREEVQQATGQILVDEISDTLYIGAATVKRHVSNVLTKLGLRDRAQAIVFAYESGLITPGHHGIGH